MKITFTIPFAHLTGGIRSIFELANALVDRGHDCFVASPHQPLPMGETLRGKIKRSLFALADHFLFDQLGLNSKQEAIDWFKPRFIYKKVRYLTNYYLPKSDYVIATNWRTASWVKALDEGKGRKRYLVLDLETFDRGSFSNEKVEQTYGLIPYIITYSNFVATELRERVNRNPTGRFTLGVCRKKFYPDPDADSDISQIRVGLMIRPEPHKGLEDGLKVLEIVKRKCSQVRFVGFGAPWVKELVPSYVEFHVSPSDEMLRKIYSSCHIFLSASKREGFNLPPLEAMACGCAVVSTKTGAVPEYGVQRQTILMREVGDVDGLAEDIVFLSNRPNEIKRISSNSLQAINQYSWDIAAKRFEGALEKEQ